MQSIAALSDSFLIVFWRDQCSNISAFGTTLEPEIIPYSSCRKETIVPNKL